MKKSELYDFCIAWFEKNIPLAETELHYTTPYELLVAVILSAQCTDKRVNMVVPALFDKYPNAKALAKAEPEEVFEYIRSISYPNNKAKHLVGLFDQPAIAVDTHVFRVSQRIGLVKPSKTPLEVEIQLTKNVPDALQGRFHHWLILHGRYTCMARNPNCPACGLKEVCKYYKQEIRGKE